MKIISYSDLHLEMNPGWSLPKLDADLMILAGDIISFRNFNPMAILLQNWNKPVLFVAGNHEYYTNYPMSRHKQEFRAWLAEFLPHVHFLDDEAISMGGVHFFGGTMWTDFEGGNEWAMRYARENMNDFERIREEGIFTPKYSIKLHKRFIAELTAWFQKDLVGPRVVITHHQPVTYPKSIYGKSALSPAFTATDISPLIETYQPCLWVYGHTHECAAWEIGKTRIISNQLGYSRGGGRYGSDGVFDKGGCAIEMTASDSRVEN